MWGPRCQVESDRHPLQASQSTCLHDPAKATAKMARTTKTALPYWQNQCSTHKHGCLEGGLRKRRGHIWSQIGMAGQRWTRGGMATATGLLRPGHANTTGPQQTPRRYNPRSTHRADLNPPKYIHMYKLLFPARSCGIFPFGQINISAIF